MMTRFLACATLALCVCLANADCNVADGNKIDCGVEGTTQSECQNKGCWYVSRASTFLQNGEKRESELYEEYHNSIPTPSPHPNASHPNTLLVPTCVSRDP